MLKVLIAAAVTLGAPASGCGVESDCAIAGGAYRIALPAGAEPSPLGAIVYLHGYQGSPEDTMGFAALRGVADRLGVALIAPAGLEKSWSLPGALRQRRDDIAFVRAVVTDAVARFGVDPARVMVSGFSVGASMVWYVACAEGQHYAGYAPVAGSFWEPYVADCATPLAEIHHVHGRADTTVPMAGRKLSFATQGDTLHAFALLRRFSGCGDGLEGEEVMGDLTCARQVCGGAIQELCLHSGAHSVRPEWIERAWGEVATTRGWR